MRLCRFKEAAGATCCQANTQQDAPHYMQQPADGDEDCHKQHRHGGRCTSANKPNKETIVIVVYYKDESECNAQMDAHAQRPRHQDNIQAQHQNHQTHRLRKSMGKESARGESRRDLSKAAAASKGAIG